MAGNVITISDSNFDEEVGASSLALVDFWATWCAPCLAIAPHVEAIAKEYVGKVKVGKVNIDENSAISGKFGIRSIPTLILFKEGKPIDQVIGAVSKSKIEEMISRHL